MKENLVLLLCVGALLVGQALSQEGACTRLTDEDIGNTTGFSNEGLLASRVGSLGEGVTAGEFRVDGVQIVCEAQHEMQDRYRFTSALVTYACMSTDNRLDDICDGTQQTAQLTLACSEDNTWSTNIFNNVVVALTKIPAANTSTALASNCILCIPPTHMRVTSDITIIVQPQTYCVECDSCNTGLERCYGTLNMQTCCNFFNDNSCVVECPMGLFPNNTDNVCGGCRPLSADNGDFSYSSDQLIGSVATLDCNDGYTENMSPATCSSSGWSTAPCCTTLCPLLSLLQMGEIEYSSSARGEGTTATHTCDIDYILVPENGVTRTCETGGSWSGMAPACDACSNLIENCKECSYVNGMVTCNVCAAGFTVDGTLCIPIDIGTAETSSCDIACIIGIVLAIVAVIVITTVVIVVAFVLYKYLNDPATKLAKTDAEGLNGVARDNPLYVEPAAVTEEGVDGATETTPLDS